MDKEGKGVTENENADHGFEVHSDTEEDSSDDSYDEQDETGEGDEEFEAEAYKQFKVHEYELMAERKRKALCSDSEGSEKKGKKEDGSSTTIMETVYSGVGRKLREPKARGRKKRSKKKLSPEISQMLGYATLQYAHGRYKEAISVLEKVIRLAPNLSDAYHTLGLVHHALGNSDLAMEAYKIAADIKPKDSSLWKLLFNWSIEKGDMSSALNYVNKALKVDPNDANLRFRHASLCEDFGKDQRAAESYEELSRLCPGDVEVLKRGTELYLKCGQREHAVRILKDYFKGHPSEADPNVIDLLASVFMEVKALNEALEHIQHVQITYYHGKELPLNLKIREAICYIHLGQMEKAEILLGVVQEETIADHVELIIGVADAFKTLGNFNNALKYYHMLEGNTAPFNEGCLHLKMAQCYLSLKDSVQAIAFFYKALRKLEDNIDARVTLVSLLLEDARIDEAICVLSPPESLDLTEQKPEAWWLNERIRLKLSSIYSARGMLDEFADLSLPLILDWIQRKVKGKKRQTISSLCERVDNQHSEKAPHTYRRVPASGLLGSQVKRSSQVKVSPKLRARPVKVDCRSDGTDNELVQETVKDEEYHNLFIELCKSLVSLRRYWEALEIVNLARKLDISTLPTEKKEELQSLGAQISCDTMDPKQWFDCVKSVIQQHPHQLAAWNCYYRVFSRFEKRFTSGGKFLHNMRVKHKDCVPPVIICGNQFSVTSRHQDAAREYLEAYKMLPESPLVNLCAGTALINLALGLRLQNKHQCAVQGLAFLYNNLRLCESSQESLYNLGRAYHHIGHLTLATLYYEKVLASYQKDHPLPKLPNEGPELADHIKPGYCDLRREAAHNLHLIYKSSGSFDLARQILKDHCTF